MHRKVTPIPYKTRATKMHKSQVSCILAERHVVHFRDKTGITIYPIFQDAEGLWLPMIASVQSMHVQGPIGITRKIA